MKWTVCRRDTVVRVVFEPSGDEGTDADVLRRAGECVPSAASVQRPMERRRRHQRHRRDDLLVTTRQFISNKTLLKVDRLQPISQHNNIRRGPHIIDYKHALTRALTDANGLLVLSATGTACC